MEMHKMKMNFFLTTNNGFDFDLKHEVSQQGVTYL
jgi:hypothetical protein